MARTVWISSTAICWLCFIVTSWTPFALAAGPHDVGSIRLQPVGNATYAPVITALAIDPRGEFIAASGDDHAIRILSLASLQTVKILSLHEDWVQTLDFSRDGATLVSAGNDGQVLLWNRDRDWENIQRITGAPAIRCARFSPDGTKVAAVGFQPQLFLLGVGTTWRSQLKCGCRDLRSVAFRGDGSIVAVAGRSGDVHLFDTATGSAVDEVKLHGDRIRSLLFISDTSRLVTAAEDGHAIVYDVDARGVVRDLQVPGCKLQAAAMVDLEHVAIGGTDNVVYVFNLTSGKRIATLDGHTGSIAALAGRNGELFSGSFDTTLRRWRLPRLSSDARVAETEAAAGPEARTSRRP